MHIKNSLKCNQHFLQKNNTMDWIPNKLIVKRCHKTKQMTNK